MAGSVQIKVRKVRTKHPVTNRLERYYVYWRHGGGGHKTYYGGAFARRKDAETRAHLIMGELAAGREPFALLESFKTPAKPPPGLLDAWNLWIASKRKVKSTKLYANSRDRWVPILGETTDPATINFLDVSAGVDELLGDLSPNSVRQYTSHLAMVLDYALPDGTPNPARSKKLELPSGNVRVLDAPTNDEWAKLQAAISKRSLPLLRLMECCALRVSEACGIRPGDVDAVSGKFLVRREVTKTVAGRRWVPAPPELLDWLLEPGSRLEPSQVYYDIKAACDKAGIRRMGTHAFRRRRISLWYAQGVDGPQVARWAGHAKPSESMDTYAFEVMDVLADEWFSFWQKARTGTHGGASVGHERVDAE